MAEIAPMLAHFGYDPEGNPPNYGEGDIACSLFFTLFTFSGKPDKFVVDNTNDIKEHDRDWEEIGKIYLSNLQVVCIWKNVGKTYPGLHNEIFLKYFFNLFHLQLKGWKAWVRKILLQGGRKTRSKILTSEEKLGKNTFWQSEEKLGKTKKILIKKWRRYNWMVEWSKSQKGKMYFWKLGSYCCISPVLSICRFKITDAVILLRWMIKLRICGTRFSGFVFERQPTFFTFCEVALSLLRT